MEIVKLDIGSAIARPGLQVTITGPLGKLETSPSIRHQTRVFLD
jgi:hypothetical protein